jgi:hypothetical protein
MNKAR